MSVYHCLLFLLFAHRSYSAKNVMITQHFELWKQDHDMFDKFNSDYPYGWPNFGCKRPDKFLPPSDIHSLAPWNVEVIAALGDSLSTARAAEATDLDNLFVDSKGLSFAIGEDQTLDQMATLASIFRHFSPDLEGSSTSSSDGFNVAKASSHSSDLVTQATKLISRMKSKLGVGFYTKWKFVNVFIGSNDLCDICNNEALYGTSQYIDNIKNMVLLLQKELPRTYVNLIPAFDPYTLKDLEEENPFCVDFHRKFCPCILSMDRQSHYSLVTSFWKALDIFYEPEYHSDTFTIAINPIIANISHVPILGSTANLAFTALDCFHFSRMAHDMVAKLVWRTLFEAVETRQSLEDFNNFDPSLWECPPEACPYLKTIRNSQNCTTNPLRWPNVDLRDQTIPTAKIPSISTLEQLASAEERSHLSYFIIFGLALTIILIILIASTVQKQNKKKKRQMYEGTPLLLTANLYDDVF